MKKHSVRERFTVYCSFDGSIVYKEKTAKQLLVAALNA